MAVCPPFNAMTEKFTFLQPYFGEARSGARSFVVAQGGSGDDAWAVIANDGGDYIESFNRVCIKEEGCFRFYERELASFCTPEFGYFIITRSMIVSETLVSNVSEMLETVGSSDDQLSLGFDARKLETVDQVGCDYKVTGFSEAVSAKFQPTSTASLRSAVLAYCSNPAQWDGSPIAEWDTSLVFSFERVFAGLRGDCGSPDLNKWATSQVTNMEVSETGSHTPSFAPLAVCALFELFSEFCQPFPALPTTIYRMLNSIYVNILSFAEHANREHLRVLANSTSRSRSGMCRTSNSFRCVATRTPFAQGPRFPNRCLWVAGWVHASGQSSFLITDHSYPDHAHTVDVLRCNQFRLSPRRLEHRKCGELQGHVRQRQAIPDFQQ